MTMVYGLTHLEDLQVLNFHFKNAYNRREHLVDEEGFSAEDLQNNGAENGHQPSAKGRLSDIHDRLLRDLKADGEAAKYLRAAYHAANPDTIKDAGEISAGRS